MIGLLFGNPLFSFAATTKKTTQTAVKKSAIKKTTTKKPQQKIVPKQKEKINPRRANLLILSEHDVHISPGEGVSVRVGFKNSGSTAWGVRELRAATGSDTTIFSDVSWPSTTTLARDDGSPLAAGRLEFYDFIVRAPDQPGAYLLRASLYADGLVVNGGDISLPITVEIQESVVPTSTAEIVQLPHEPNIRVALGKIEGGILVRTVGEYDLKTLDGTEILSVPDGAKLLWEFDRVSKGFMVTYQGTPYTTATAFRLQPRTLDGRVIIHDREDRPSWNGSINYNDYRGALEVQWSDKIPGLWLINELPMESYVRGLIETGNSDPIELQKAIYTAARSYAYVQLPDGVHYISRMWDVHAVWDQYYKGYAAEKSNPHGMQAIEETRGQVVEYQGKPVVTPYFTQSNGTTKTWKEAWGGTNKPWLIPVDAKYDHGRKMWGHGVGMSNHDAKQRAKLDGWSFEQILKHYYTGVELARVYE